LGNDRPAEVGNQVRGAPGGFGARSSRDWSCGRACRAASRVGGAATCGSENEKIRSLWCLEDSEVDARCCRSAEAATPGEGETQMQGSCSASDEFARYPLISVRHGWGRNFYPLADYLLGKGQQRGYAIGRVNALPALIRPAAIPKHRLSA
jgi:hypothetical protein